MTGLIHNLLNLLRSRNRKRLKEKAKRLVERDRILQNRMARAG
ncbi:MAG: hypothetical protein Q9N26_04160 [Aquificota bacterium]|nr:hypothetical protein [Aquificota bacterium]MDQ7082622.1 hypothetical protein [Aquificota bacterium]